MIDFVCALEAISAGGLSRGSFEIRRLHGKGYLHYALKTGYTTDKLCYDKGHSWLIK